MTFGNEVVLFILLVIELTQQCHAPFYPVLLGLVCGDLNGYDKVSGVSSGGQGASSVTRLVDRGQVGGTIWDIIPFPWLHPNLYE